MKNTNQKIEFMKISFKEKVRTAKDTYTYKFEIPQGFTWNEGDHIHLAFLDLEENGIIDKSKARTFSIMSQESENYLGVTTRIKEPCSDYKKRLDNLKENDQMLLFKPGNNMKLIRENKSLVFISMGVGIATFRPLIREFNENTSGIEKIFNINIDSSKCYVYEDELAALNNKKLINYYLDSRVKLYDVINQNLSDEENIYYIVGSNQFLSQIAQYLIENNVARDNIVIDKKPSKRINFIPGELKFKFKNAFQ